MTIGLLRRRRQLGHRYLADRFTRAQDDGPVVQIVHLQGDFSFEAGVDEASRDVDYKPKPTKTRLSVYLRLNVVWDVYVLKR